MPNLVYNAFAYELGAGNIDLDGGTFKVMLVSGSYTPDRDTHADRADVTDEVIGTGYTAGGNALISPTLTQENADDLAKWDDSDATWPNSTITDARAAIVYKSTGAAANDTLVAYYDFGSNKSSSSGDFTVQWNASGLLSIKTVA